MFALHLDACTCATLDLLSAWFTHTSMQPQIRTVRTLLRDAATRLGDRTDAEWLLLHTLDRPRTWLFAHADDPVQPELQGTYEALVERRAAGEPVAYLIGTAGFWSLELEVTPATLIPRPETEVLVEQALLRLSPCMDVTVADLGTGSGAVAIALASERPRATILATDISDAALDVAKRNVKRFGMTKVRFAQGDWDQALGASRFDLIVSNPPYIEAGDAHLQRGDLRFEPQAALSSGDDGLDAIRRIVERAPAHLAPEGWLLFEHGWNQGLAAREILTRHGYRHVATADDLESRERVTRGMCPPGAIDTRVADGEAV